VNKFRLDQNYPNPFNCSTTIRYSLDKEVRVELDIFNLTGQKVRTLVHALQTPGFKTVIWDGLDDHGNLLSTGLYLYQLRSEELRQSQKMLLLK
jgi:flagellar hook assembly protein FlgD